MQGVEEARRHALEREELLAALVAAAESLCTLTAESEVPSRAAHFPDEMFHFIASGLGDKVDRCVVVTEAGSCLRLIDFCITQLKAQGPSRTCNESEEED